MYQSGCPLYVGEAVDNPDRHPLMRRKREVFDTTLRLPTPVGIGRDVDGT